MKRTILLMAVCLCFIGNASAQWVVSDPGNLAQGIINTTKQIVQTSTTAKNTLDGFMEAQKIFQQEKTTKKIGGFHFAERTRFELVVRVTPHAGLANRWYKPLTHLSGPAYTP